jgi:hypothetical protein
MKKAILIFAFSIWTASTQAQVPDIGTYVNNQIASLPTVTQNGQTWAQGTVNITAGTYNLSTTIALNSPYVNLRCEPGTILIYNGSGDAIRILPSTQISGAAPTQPNQGPSVTDCSIYNISPTAISGIHAGDIAKIHLINVAVNNFNGTATSAAYWFDNTVSFTEGMALVDITANNNSIAMRFTNTSGTNSFGYTSIRGFRAQVRTNQIGFSVETNTFLYHSYIDAIVETSDASATVMSVTGTGKVGGNQGDDVIFLRGECVNINGNCTGATLLKLESQTQFVANGFMNGLGVTMKTQVAPGAVLTWNGTTALNQSTNSFGWSADGSIRFRFANSTAVSLFANNVRLGGPFVLGWSTGPTTAANYVGFSPCAIGTAVLCLGNGKSADSSAGLSAGAFFAPQFIGNSAVPTVVAGPGAGMGATVTLTPGSTSVSGSALFTTGTSPAKLSPAVTVAFATPLAHPPNTCTLVAQNAITALAMVSLYTDPPTTTGFVLSTGLLPLLPSNTYQVGYTCF